jgi:hypothetical protein
MRFSIPAHRLSVDPGDAWIPDPITPGSEHVGAYLRSLEFGIYLNVREDDGAGHPLTKDGMVALLREQNWGPAIDEWHGAAGDLVMAGGSFEASGMRGEIVMEIFVTDGRRVADLAGPGPREIIAKVRPSAQKLAASIRFG